jgi:outer membrane immunogenic protein
MRNGKFVAGAALVASVLTGITAASAADMAPRMYSKAPAPAAIVYGWTGFYIGGNVGYSWGRSSNTETISNSVTGALVATANSRNDVNGVIGGGQIGYNWQAQNWLFGLEADIQGSDEKGSTSFLCVACANGGNDITSTLTQRLNWFGTARGRVGVLVTPTVLLYGTGGLAFGEVSTGGSITGPTNLAPLATIAFPGTSSTRAGWTAGAGVEGRITGNWSAKLEYLYMDLGTVNSGAIATTIVVPVRTAAGVAYSSHFTDNILRVGVNYRFGGPGY